MWSNELSPDSAIAGDNFRILPDGRKNALDLAFATFPEIKDEFDSPEDEFLGDVYYVYGLRTTEIVSHWNDETLRKRSCRFLDGLAESGDSLLEDLLVVCILEAFALNPDISKKAKTCLGEKAGGFLLRVEREMFGR